MADPVAAIPIPKNPGGLPMAPQTAVFVAVLALGFGGVVGSALNGGLGGLIASASPTPPAAVVAETTPPDTALTGGGGGSGGGGRSAPQQEPVSPPAEVPVAPPATLPEDPPLDPPLDPPPDDPPKPEQERVSGTVVRVNPLAESYSVAEGSGALSTIHATKLPDAGAEIQVPVDPLFNTTSAEAGRRKEDGSGENVTFSGTVTWVDEKAGTYVVSSAGASVVVTVPEPEQGARDMPALTAGVTVKAELAAREADPPSGDPAAAEARRPAEEGGPRAAGRAATATEPPAGEAPASRCEPERAYPEDPVVPAVELRQVSYEVEFDSLSYALLEGVVQAVCDDESQIVVSADDVRELGADLVLAVPKQIDPALVEEGSSITAAVDPEPAEDGTHALYGIAGDDGIDGADDEKLGQGDLDG
ncbi:MAG: hypothetical protein U0R51_09960 [Solirubrobacterales bacterium]